MKRDAKKLALALLVGAAFFVSTVELDRAIRAIQYFGQSTVACGYLECGLGRKANSCRYYRSFYNFECSSADLCDDKAAGASGERRWCSVDQYGYRRLSQAGNALVWKDQARQIHAGI